MYAPRMSKSVERIKMRVIAIDPGDKHVGVVHNLNGHVTAFEYDADVWLISFEALLRCEVDVVVVEAFRLYPDKAQSLSRSRMKTSEMIGAIKWIASKAGCRVVEQGAAIKTPTRAQCKARGIDIVDSSTHAQDALLHFYYYLLRNKLEV